MTKTRNTQECFGGVGFGETGGHFLGARCMKDDSIL